MSFSKLGAEIWRDYETDGVPASGAHSIPKADMRSWMAVVEAIVDAAAQEAGPTSVSAASTTDLGASGVAVVVTGAATIASFGSSALAGAVRFVRFAGACTLTYNATSLITPNSVDITGDAGARALVWHEGSGNWRVLAYWFGAGDVGIGREPSAAFLHVAAGTVSKAAAKLTSGALLTTPAAGVFEYDGKAVYFTPAANARAVALIEHVLALTSDQTGANSASAQPLFPVGSGELTLQSDTTYEFDAEVIFTRAAGTTSHTIALLFGGSASFTSLRSMIDVSNPSGNALGTVSRIYVTGAGSVTVTGANTSATENVCIRMSGIMRINAGGTVIPQFQYSAAPGGAPTVLANSFFRARPIGDNTVQAVGNWS